MKRILTLFALLGWAVGYGQLYDAQWTMGYFPVSDLSFQNDTVILDTLGQSMFAFNLTNADICDEQGNLLFVTNGIYIADKNGDTLVNGNGINPCYWTDVSACCGLDIPQAALFLPKPGHTRYYYLFHFSDDAVDSSRPGIIYYSLIDKEGNGGLGTVIEKNIPIIQNVNFRDGGMTACKHANGRDYWVVIGGFNSNTFYKFLVTPDSVEGPFTQSIGPYFKPPSDVAYSKFSQDGSKYVTGIYQGPILVMDFDRCSGTFSNPDTIFNEGCNAPGSCDGIASVEFSPNGRFVYATDVYRLNQYDLYNPNIQDSVSLYDNSSSAPELDMLQIAPNGKIYISTWNGIIGFDSIHVINNPDAKGDSCNFVYGGQPIAYADGISLPNMINYRLGPLVGSGCDTILSIQETGAKSQKPRVIPNPADKYVYIEMGMQGDYEFELLDGTGQVIGSKQTRQVDIFDTENLANGFYLVQILDRQNNTVVGVQKVVVAH